MSETDLQLLARYAHKRAEDAFGEIVRRHVNLVHSAALRQVRSPELAEEVAQAVFIELARRAGQLPPDTVVGAWLYQITRRRAIDVVRREAGRRSREQTAQELHTMNVIAEDWTHIEPILDDAMDALEEIDRLAVLLRYFQNKPLREVGHALGVTDDAAQKRVVRAVERLREFFANRGVTVGACGLVIALSTNAVEAAPAGLAATIFTAASAIAGTGFTTTISSIAAKAIAMTAMPKTFITAGLVVAISIVIYEAKQAGKARAESESLRERLLGVEQADQSGGRDNFAQELATLLAERESWNRNAAELATLRREAAALQRRVAELSNQVSIASNPYGLLPGQMPPARSSSVADADAYAMLMRKRVMGQLNLAEEFNLAKAWPYLGVRFREPEDFANFQSAYLAAYLGVNDEDVRWEMRRILETARQHEQRTTLLWARMTDEEIQRLNPAFDFGKVDLHKIRRQWTQLNEQTTAEIVALLSDGQRELTLSTFNTLLDFDPRLKSSYPNNPDDPKYQGVSPQEAAAAFFPPRVEHQVVPAKSGDGNSTAKSSRTVLRVLQLVPATPGSVKP